MQRRHAHPPEQAANGDDPLEACERAIDSLRAKADRNEQLARMATGSVIFASALIPVCLIASAEGHPFLWGKLAPALLAAVSAVAAGWLQFERPHERWKLYRGYQRKLELERFHYQNGIGEYALDAAQREQRLGLVLAQTLERLHQEWSGLLPVNAETDARNLASRLSQPDGGPDP